MLSVDREPLRRGARLFRSPQHRPGGDAPGFAMPVAAGTEGPPAIVMTNATKRYGRLTALEDLSLSVPFGSMLGLIGPSGAGKTTTMRLLTGGLAPSAGSVEVLGENPRRFKRRTRERIGYMPQLFVLYPDLTAEENVSFVASLFGMFWRRRRRRVREVLVLVDLWDARKRRASDLSGGMQRRLELACALVHDPFLLILDEPTAGIDPLLRRAVWDELRRLRDADRTLIVTTQYVGDAEECDEIALIAGGRLVALATPEQLRRDALGGEVVEIETAQPFDATTLESVPMVRSVRQPGARNIWVITENAGAATPALVAAVRAAGGELVNAREYRPSFDEVFAELVNRQEAADAAAGELSSPVQSRDARRPPHGDANGAA
jgi:ABC-2 type transport system ATP-binding protein